MLKRQIALTAIGSVLLAATAIAQTSAPSPSAPSASPPAASTEAAKQPEQNLAAPGKWRASKLMGVDIYGADDKKVGDVTEVVFDKSGKIEMVTVGVGGFLGIGAKDVAIPFEQITWSDAPIVQPAPAPAAPSGGSGSMTGASPTPPSAASAPKGPTMYPDHGKIAMTKDQLTAAPAVTYATR
ncbi:PRC-barrel domain containing protein [Bosea caraganae]|nr:PRC-barrel domain containing protein [Bosea caraganae]